MYKYIIKSSKHLFFLINCNFIYFIFGISILYNCTIFLDHSLDCNQSQIARVLFLLFSLLPSNKEALVFNFGMTTPPFVLACILKISPTPAVLLLLNFFFLRAFFFLTATTGALTFSISVSVSCLVFVSVLVFFFFLELRGFLVVEDVAGFLLRAERLGAGAATDAATGAATGAASTF